MAGAEGERGAGTAQRAGTAGRAGEQGWRAGTGSGTDGQGQGVGLTAGLAGGNRGRERQAGTASSTSWRECGWTAGTPRGLSTARTGRRCFGGDLARRELLAAGRACGTLAKSRRGNSCREGGGRRAGGHWLAATGWRPLAGGHWLAAEFKGPAEERGSGAWRTTTARRRDRRSEGLTGCAASGWRGQRRGAASGWRPVGGTGVWWCGRRGGVAGRFVAGGWCVARTGGEGGEVFAVLGCGLGAGVGSWAGPGRGLAPGAVGRRGPTGIGPGSVSRSWVVLGARDRSAVVAGGPGVGPAFAVESSGALVERRSGSARAGGWGGPRVR